MNVRSCVIFMLMSLVFLEGCSWNHSKSSVAVFSLNDAFDDARTTSFGVVQPVTGLFIGVSNYGDKAKKGGIKDTSAHTLGAALFQEFFYRGLINSGLEPSHLTLLADLRAPDFDSDSVTPFDIASHSKLPQLLREIKGTHDQLFESPTNAEGIDYIGSAWEEQKSYFGRGELVTRERILTALANSLSDFRSTFSLD